METFSSVLLSEIEVQLQNLEPESNDPVRHAEQAITILLTALEKLKKFIGKYKFTTESEEIRFFRELKPRFTCSLIYYNEIYRISTNRPYGNIKEQRKYLEHELQKLKRYFVANCEFYRYYRTDSHHLDKNYFVRGNTDVKLTVDSYFFLVDSRFSTSHDYKVAMILANEMLDKWLQRQISDLACNQTSTSNIAAKTQKWTGSKVALIELMYALHAEGVFNNGNADLKEVASLLESAFNVDLGQYHRTFLEIRARKYERTKFLSGLKERLLVRMEEADS